MGLGLLLEFVFAQPGVVRALAGESRDLLRHSAPLLARPLGVADGRLDLGGEVAERAHL